MIAALLALALAQPLPEPVLADVDYEVVVTADRDVAEARERVQQAVRDLGYGRGLTLGQRTHHRHPLFWKGGVMVHEQGFARIHVPRFVVLPGTPEDPVPKAARSESQLLKGETPTLPPVASVTFLIGGRRWRQGQLSAIASALEPHLREYRDAIAHREQAWRLLELHGVLDRAWEAGLAPDGTPIGDTPADRRAWLADRWLNTADTVDGAEVRLRIAQFVQLRVQPSDHPFTEAELASLAARSPFLDPLLVEP